MQDSKSYHLIVTESQNVNSRYFTASVVKRQAGRARVSHAAFLIDISCFDDKEDLIRGIRLTPGEGVAGHVAQTGKPLFLPDVQGRPEFTPRVDALTGRRLYEKGCPYAG